MYLSTRLPSEHALPYHVARFSDLEVPLPWFSSMGSRSMGAPDSSSRGNRVCFA